MKAMVLKKINDLLTKTTTKEEIMRKLPGLRWATIQCTCQKMFLMIV